MEMELPHTELDQTLVGWRQMLQQALSGLVGLGRIQGSAQQRQRFRITDILIKIRIDAVALLRLHGRPADGLRRQAAVQQRLHGALMVLAQEDQRGDKREHPGDQQKERGRTTAEISCQHLQNHDDWSSKTQRLYKPVARPVLTAPTYALRVHYRSYSSAWN